MYAERRHDDEYKQKPNTHEKKEEILWEVEKEDEELKTKDYVNYGP